jgi:hypothetical protein
VLGWLWLITSATWREITLAESLHVWNCTLGFALQQRKSMESLSHFSRVVRYHSLRQLGRLLRDNLGWTAEHQFTSFRRRRLHSALSRHKCLPSCRTKWVHCNRQLWVETLSQCSDVVSEKWNIKILANLSAKTLADSERGSEQRTTRSDDRNPS